MRAYILIDVAVAKSEAVCRQIQDLHLPGVAILTADVVTGPFDVVTAVEFDDLDQLAQGIIGGIQQLDGVQRTTTCLVITRV